MSPIPLYKERCGTSWDRIRREKLLYSACRTTERSFADYLWLLGSMLYIYQLIGNKTISKLTKDKWDSGTAATQFIFQKSNSTLFFFYSQGDNLSWVTILRQILFKFCQENALLVIFLWLTIHCSQDRRSNQVNLVVRSLGDDPGWLKGRETRVLCCVKNWDERLYYISFYDNKSL